MTRLADKITPVQPFSKPRGAGSVMASRLEPPDSLEFFPTPPWATRALLQHVLADEPVAECTCWEPAAGEGHMSLVLDEYFKAVYASDVHDYGHLDAIGSFTGNGPDVLVINTRHDWIITNPPFTLAVDFAERALDECWRGVALFVRLSWLESLERYQFLRRHPASIVALFSERVNLAKGRWEPDGSTATAYAWIVWKRAHSGPTTFMHIPPGQRRALQKPDDVARFARPKPVEAGAEQVQGALV